MMTPTFPEFVSLVADLRAAEIAFKTRAQIPDYTRIQELEVKVDDAIAAFRKTQREFDSPKPKEGN